MSFAGLLNNRITIWRPSYGFDQGERKQTFSQAASDVPARVAIQDPERAKAERDVGGQSIPVPRIRIYAGADVDLREEDEIVDQDGLRARILYVFDFHKMGHHISAVAEQVKNG